MTRSRGAPIATAVLWAVSVAAGCGGGGAAAGDGGAGKGGAAGGGDGGADGAAGVDVDAADVRDGASEAMDVATDFGETASVDAAADCPKAAGVLAAASADVLIDDFTGQGKLDGRSRQDVGFSVTEQFDATTTAQFDPAPAVEPTCGAAGPGAAHIRGTPTDSGATFTLIFGSANGDGGKPLPHYDASATTGITFRAALGHAKATQLFTLQYNLDGSQWDYTRDVIVAGTTWQQVTILWSDLESAAAAPKFSPAALNQIVFPFTPDTDVDLYIDDVAFTR
jgi:hypothetical protein